MGIVGSIPRSATLYSCDPEQAASTLRASVCKMRDTIHAVDTRIRHENEAPSRGPGTSNDQVVTIRSKQIKN